MNQVAWYQTSAPSQPIARRAGGVSIRPVAPPLPRRGSGLPFAPSGGTGALLPTRWRPLMKLEVGVCRCCPIRLPGGTLLPWRKQVGETVAARRNPGRPGTDKVILEIRRRRPATLVELRSRGAVGQGREVWR